MFVEKAITYYGIQLEGGKFATIRGKKAGGEISYLVLALFHDKEEAIEFARTEIEPHAKYYVQPFTVNSVSEVTCVP